MLFSQCVELSEKMNKSGEVLIFEQLGFYQLLLSMENTQALHTYVDQVLGKLLRYDKENKGELVATLKVYLEQNCSLTQTAECLHAHKNTVKYRAQRMEEVLGRSLTDSYARLELYSAILILEIL